MSSNSKNKPVTLRETLLKLGSDAVVSTKNEDLLKLASLLKTLDTPAPGWDEVHAVKEALLKGEVVFGKESQKINRQKVANETKVSSTLRDLATELRQEAQNLDVSLSEKAANYILAAKGLMALKAKQ